MEFEKTPDTAATETEQTVKVATLLNERKTELLKDNPERQAKVLRESLDNLARLEGDTSLSTQDRMRATHENLTDLVIASSMISPETLRGMYSKKTELLNDNPERQAKVLRGALDNLARLEGDTSLSTQDRMRATHENLTDLVIAGSMISPETLRKMSRKNTEILEDNPERQAKVLRGSLDNLARLEGDTSLSTQDRMRVVQENFGNIALVIGLSREKR